MATVQVDLAERSYEVRVENGLLEQAGAAISKLALGKRAAVVTDTRVGPLHASTLLTSLANAGIDATLHEVEAGESSKSMSTAESVCRLLVEAGHDRKSFVIALGGGVIGDLAGFVAAVFYRGVPFVQIPTTIVAQVDSSVGGKTGVNLPEGKNLLGAFHQPRLVLVDPQTLSTLPGREYREGYAEVIKHAAIRDGAMLDEIAALDPATRFVPEDLIARNIAIKARVVESDEQETKNIRALLNFGHTIGHGIEASVPYGQMLHGEAISLGLRAALFLSERHAGLNPEVSRKINGLLQHFSLPLVLEPALTTGRIMDKLSRDKKFESGSIRFVLLRAAGDAFVSDQVTAQDLRDAIEFLRNAVGG